MSDVAAPRKALRKSLEVLVREVAAEFARDGGSVTVQELADRLTEHPWRVVDAIDAYALLGGR